MPQTGAAHPVWRIGIDLTRGMTSTRQGHGGPTGPGPVPALRPDVAVPDVRLPGLVCLMLASFDDEETLLDSIMAGAAGYVLKQIEGSDWVSAVRTVARGQLLLDPSATAKPVARLRVVSNEGRRRKRCPV